MALTITWYLLVTTASLLTAAVVLYFKIKFGYWNKRGVPNFPPTIPFGNAYDVVTQKVSPVSELINVYMKWRRMRVRYAGYYLFHKSVFVPFDPELIKAILVTDFHRFADRGFYISEEIDPLGAHLFNLRGDKWKNLRAKLTPTFTSGKTKMMFPIVVDCAIQLNVLVNSLVEEGSVIDVRDVMGRYTTDVIGSCAFGIDCNSIKDPNSKFRRYGKKALEFGFVKKMKYMVALAYPGILKLMGTGLVHKDTREFLLSTVRQTVDYREKNNIIRKDFMQLLIQLKNNAYLEHKSDGVDIKRKENNGHGTTLDIVEMTAQVLIFFLAGYETSSTTLTFLLYELAVNPHVQTNLRKEINETLRRHNQNITYDVMIEMHYLHRCIDETLRKYPIIPMLNRECTADYKVPGSDLVLEKGQLVFIPCLGLHYDPEYYPDPDRFEPDRFTKEGKATRHHFTWMPFGEGPRNCIGLRFAYIEIKVAAIMLLKDYKFAMHPKTSIPLAMEDKSFLLSPKGGIWLTVEKIEKMKG